MRKIDRGASAMDFDARRRCLLAAGLALFGLTGCGPPNPDLIFRVRLTFHFGSPAGNRSYSGVWEAWSTLVSQFPNPGQGVVDTLIGEAIPMSFDNGRVVFALLVYYGGSELKDSVGLFDWQTVAALDNAYHFDGSVEAFLANPPTMPEVLPPASMPALITFTDLADPSSGRFITPTELPEIAGKGWIFDRADIQVVSDPPTTGASRLLPWITAPLPKSEDHSWTNIRQHPEYFLRKPPAW